MHMEVSKVSMRLRNHQGILSCRPTQVDTDTVGNTVDESTDASKRSCPFESAIATAVQ